MSHIQQPRLRPDAPIPMILHSPISFFRGRLQRNSSTHHTIFPMTLKTDPVFAVRRQGTKEGPVSLISTAIVFVLPLLPRTFGQDSGRTSAVSNFKFYAVRLHAYAVNATLFAEVNKLLRPLDSSCFSPVGRRTRTGLFLPTRLGKACLTASLKIKNLKF